MRKFLSTVLRRTRDQVKRWGMWIGGVLEIITITVGVAIKGWSLYSLGESALIGFVPFVALGIGFFVWNLISEPHRSVVARIEVLETRATSLPIYDRDAVVYAGLKELKDRFRRLIHVLRLLEQESSQPYTPMPVRRGIDRDTVKEIEDALIFFINEMRRVDPELHKRLSGWFYNKNKEGMSVANLVDRSSMGRSSKGSLHGKLFFPHFFGKERFLRQKLVDLQSMC